MAILTETNEQYYAGQQAFIGDGAIVDFLWTGDTTLVATIVSTSNANFTVTLDNVAQVEGVDYTLSATNNVQFAVAPLLGQVILIQLNDPALWSNYGGYAYITLEDVINNFLVAYVGEGKLIPGAKRTDVMFHAKRGLQEFSYDTLKSIKSQELTIPPSLSVIIPQDYVNYVRLSWIDDSGVKRIIYPTTLTSNPYTVPAQDANGIPTQDDLGDNLEGTSLTNERWEALNQTSVTGDRNDFNVYNWSWEKMAYGQRYGMLPEISQSNGWFTIDEREGKFSFSSNLASKLIILEYVSDGLALDADSRIPKMAEEAIYMHIAYSILAGRSGVQEYIVQRFKKDRRASLRNAKIRLSNIKLGEIAQVMRGKSKRIKH
jgi:hypothetical protein